MAGIAQALVPLLSKGLEVAQPHIKKAAQDGDADKNFAPATVITTGKTYSHGGQQKTVQGVVVCDIVCTENTSGQITCPAEARCIDVRNVK